MNKRPNLEFQEFPEAQQFRDGPGFGGGPARRFSGGGPPQDFGARNNRSFGGPPGPRDHYHKSLLSFLMALSIADLF